MKCEECQVTMWYYEDENAYFCPICGHSIKELNEEPKYIS